MLNWDEYVERYHLNVSNLPLNVLALIQSSDLPISSVVLLII